MGLNQERESEPPCMKRKLPKYTLEETLWRRVFGNNYCFICMKYFEMRCSWIDAIEDIWEKGDCPEEFIGSACEHFE